MCACLADNRSSSSSQQQLLADKGCCLPLGFPPESSGISSDQSSNDCGCPVVRGGCKLCACLAGTRTRSSCLPTKSAAFLLALQCYSVRGGCKLACGFGTRSSSCLPTKAAAFVTEEQPFV